MSRPRLAQWISAAAGRLWQPWCRRLRGSGAANPQPASAQIKTLLDPPYPLNDLIQLHLVAGIRPITGSHLSLHVDHRRFQRGHAVPKILGLGVEFIAEIAQLIAQCLEVLQQQVDDFYAGWRQNARPYPAFLVRDMAVLAAALSKGHLAVSMLDAAAQSLAGLVLSTGGVACTAESG